MQHTHADDILWPSCAMLFLYICKIKANFDLNDYMYIPSLPSYDFVIRINEKENRWGREREEEFWWLGHNLRSILTIYIICHTITQIKFFGHTLPFSTSFTFPHKRSVTRKSIVIHLEKKFFWRTHYHWSVMNPKMSKTTSKKSVCLMYSSKMLNFI